MPLPMPVLCRDKLLYRDTADNGYLSMIEAGLKAPPTSATAYLTEPSLAAGVLGCSLLFVTLSRLRLLAIDCLSGSSYIVPWPIGCGTRKFSPMPYESSYSSSLNRVSSSWASGLPSGLA